MRKNLGGKKGGWARDLSYGFMRKTFFDQGGQKATTCKTRGEDLRRKKMFEPGRFSGGGLTGLWGEGVKKRKKPGQREGRPRVEGPRKHQPNPWGKEKLNSKRGLGTWRGGKTRKNRKGVGRTAGDKLIKTLKPFRNPGVCCGGGTPIHRQGRKRTEKLVDEEGGHNSQPKMGGKGDLN